MDGPTDRVRPEAEFRGQSIPRRSRAPVAAWVVALALVALVAIAGRAVVPPEPAASAPPAIADAATAKAPTGAPASPTPKPVRLVLVEPHGPVVTLVDDVLFVSGTVEPGIDAIEVTVTDISSSVVGQASVGALGRSGEFEANVPIRDVQRTQWLFVEVAALDGTGAPVEIVSRAVQVASLDPTA